ncbi:hypothetical protein GIB67_025613 [Kingdonia uniflora]|uniref:Uncharacterized protein n=1 Tax=Kingdonia uniflora TaxID=39325 RepID=A0A7J7N2C8_9MAGN|nr:hypothetical protein GIB67_025613 [Kingdonia uniflora]
MGNSEDQLMKLEIKVFNLTTTLGELVEQLCIANLAKAFASVKGRERINKKGVTEVDRDGGTEENYLFHGESTQHSQSDTNTSIPVEAAAPQKEKGKGKKKRAPAKQRPSVQVSEDAEFLDETDDIGMHWTDANFTCLARTWENDAHKIYKGLNGGNDFKHREAYKILAWEQRWANLRDDGLNHAVNIPRNVARRTSDNSSPGNSVGSNNLSKDPDGPPTPQSAGPNSDLDGSMYEGGTRPIGQKLYRKSIASQKAIEGVTASSSGIHALLDELRLDKMKRKKKSISNATLISQNGFGASK